MKSFAELSTEEQGFHLSILAAEAMKRYSISVADIELINHEFNATFKVTDVDGEFFALRLNVNSLRTLPNLEGEIAFVKFLLENTSLSIPSPIMCNIGGFVSTVSSDLIERPLNCVLYSWLNGEELGDEPSTEQLFALGAAMATTHIATREFELPADAILPSLKDFMWGEQNHLLATRPGYDSDACKAVTKMISTIQELIDSFYEVTTPQAIHADLHGWNVMWHEGELSVFDFDDCGIGLPIQDLATALYYLDTPEQDEALLAGYKSIQNLPEYTETQMKLLLLHRRLLLLNYLFETTNNEHKEMIPAYITETLKRIENFNKL
jgi:Ser/Thr protein kinase RdoA (MazF antagonist)